MEALQTKTFEFYLSYDKLKVLINELSTGTATYKGVIVTLQVNFNPATAQLHIDSNIAAAKGELDAGGNVPQVAATSRSMCPHPPPCA